MDLGEIKLIHSRVTMLDDELSDYSQFKFNEEFDGNLDQALIWLDRFLT